MTERCAGGVKLQFKKSCPVCGAGPGDQCAKAALLDYEVKQALVKALKLARVDLDAAAVVIEDARRETAFGIRRTLDIIDDALKLAGEA
jgi:hypothetical protein